MKQAYFIIISCKLHLIKQKFASFRKGYCIRSSFQAFNLNAEVQRFPLSVTLALTCCCMSFAFNPRPARSSGSSSLPLCLDISQRSEAAQQRSEFGTQRPGTVTWPPHPGCCWESSQRLANVFQTPLE